ncbi:MAG: hypothetical protein HRT74_08045, partial [Flavobacteriales bacterium]|nr:hypothetical protein [Flavobacteriales bacterium]
QFVLRHISSKEEYESLRKTLLAVVSDDNPRISPRPETKEKLMAMFAEDDRKGFVIWLNSLFGMPQSRSWGPTIAFATVLLAVFGTAAVFLLQDNNDVVFADLKEPNKEKTEIKAAEANQDAEGEQEREVEVKEEVEGNVETDGQVNNIKSFIVEDSNSSLSADPAENTLQIEDEFIPPSEDVTKIVADQIEEFSTDGIDNTMDIKPYEPAENMDFEDNIAMEEEVYDDKKEEMDERKAKDAANSNSAEMDFTDSTVPNILVTPPVEQDEIAEFYFDNSIGNASDVQLSSVEVISEKAISTTEVLPEPEGSLFKTESKVATSSSASNQLTLIDALYTAY